ncbi:hypothetical protein L3073_02335 [Ancylomarina sp. DW003]|nr:hypothetical protein [Ancylomarina sp. DW003]MDE5421041.1 hypothetical protein [Ancylomarina sp. DW003]
MNKIEIYHKNENELLTPFSFKEIRFKTYLIYALLIALLCVLVFYRHPVVFEQDIHVNVLSENSIEELQVYALINKNITAKIKEEDKILITIHNYSDYQLKGIIYKIIKEKQQDKVLIKLIGEAVDKLKVIQLDKKQVVATAKFTIGKECILPFVK